MEKRHLIKTDPNGFEYTENEDHTRAYIDDFLCECSNRESPGDIEEIDTSDKEDGSERRFVCSECAKAWRDEQFAEQRFLEEQEDRGNDSSLRFE